MGADEPAPMKQKKNDNQKKVPDAETDPASSRAASVAPGKVPTTKPALPEIIEPTTKPASALVISVTTPILPSTLEEFLNCDVQKLMRSLLPWCRVALVQRLETDDMPSSVSSRKQSSGESVGCRSALPATMPLWWASKHLGRRRSA